MERAVLAFPNENQRCVDMSGNKRVKRKHGSFCLICAAHKPQEWADSPFCSRQCLRKSQRRKRNAYLRRKRKGETWERNRNRCRICKAPVKHPRKFCPGHLCQECGKAAVKAKGRCWTCYIRRYRADIKLRKLAARSSSERTDVSDVILSDADSTSPPRSA